MNFKPITDNNIIEIITNLNAKKSTGADSISAKFLKSCKNPIGKAIYTVIYSTTVWDKTPFQTDLNRPKSHQYLKRMTPWTKIITGLSVYIQPIPCCLQEGLQLSEHPSAPNWRLEACTRWPQICCCQTRGFFKSFRLSFPWSIAG